jgi:hypothetical protein
MCPGCAKDDPQILADALFPVMGRSMLEGFLAMEHSNQNKKGVLGRYPKTPVVAGVGFEPTTFGL